jgi:hypothetical protein
MAAGVIFLASPLYAHEAISTTVTYDREIVRILRKKCIMCHTENNLAMPLTTYEETRPWARDIEEQVLARNMPPWRAVPGYGHFSNDLGLTNREIQFIVSWVEGNGPKSKDQTMIENFGETAAAGKEAKHTIQWRRGKPDAIANLPVDSAAPDGANLVRRVTIDPHIASDKSVQTLEFQPEDRRALRAAFFSIEETGQYLGSWTPWSEVTTLPANTAWRYPAGSHIVAELHYQNAHEPVSGGGSLGLYFAAKPAAHHTADLVLDAKPEAGEIGKLSAIVRVASESRILVLRPDVQPDIDSFEISAKKPDGTVDVLLLVRNAMPEWPTPYVFEQPITLPRDTQLTVTAYARAGKKELTGFRVTVSLYEAVVPTRVTATSAR